MNNTSLLTQIALELPSTVLLLIAILSFLRHLDRSEARTLDAIQKMIADQNTTLQRLITGQAPEDPFNPEKALQIYGDWNPEDDFRKVNGK